MKHTRRRCVALFTLLLLAVLVAACGLWLRAQRRQYALNRALIAALVEGDDGRALVLVKEGADPNTRYKATPVPSLPQLVQQLLHRSSPPTNDSPTALLIACGAEWDHTKATAEAQEGRRDTRQLVQAMLMQGSNVNVKAEMGWTPLMWAVWFNRTNTVSVLLLHGANVNVRDKYGRTALLYAVRQSKKDTDAIRQLLAHGANPNLADKFGGTPLMLAQRAKLPDIVALLKHYGAHERGKRP